MAERESMEFDVVVVGAGPAGLAAAIRLKQRAPEASVCVVEKGGEVGAHILSGAVIETRALDELIPDWRDKGRPAHHRGRRGPLPLPMTKRRAWQAPHPAADAQPRQLHRQPRRRMPLARLTQAEELGIEIYPGFAASELLFEGDRVVGIATGDMGVEKSGEHGPNYQPGMELRATYTLFGEGCRGSLSKQLMAHYDLRRGVQPQTYALGVKELWEIPAEVHQKGLIVHSIGWPLPKDTYGGSWLYHWGDNLVSYGFVVGLDYSNPWLSPFDEMQRLKTHPAMRKFFEGGRRLSYGARALSEGGWQSMPKLTFPGGALIGDSAGFLNVPKIKGTHAAMKSGMLAAEALADALESGRPAEPSGYTKRFKTSWLRRRAPRRPQHPPRLRQIRPVRRHRLRRRRHLYTTRPRPLDLQPPARRQRDPGPRRRSAKDRLPETRRQTHLRQALLGVHQQHQSHRRSAGPSPPPRPGPLGPASTGRSIRSPESRYCPAGVYEAVGVETGDPKLQINAQNCVHCKTCDIKDPSQNIDWAVPEGGGGPNYPGGM